MDSEGSATGEEKTPEPKKSSPGRPPFKVCFKVAKVSGRSDISPCHPRGLVHGVTDKFYTVRKSTYEVEPDIEEVNRAHNKGPKQSYDSPFLESHRYGWFHDVTFVDLDILKDRRLNFFKRTAPMFKGPPSSTANN